MTRFTAGRATGLPKAMTGQPDAANVKEQWDYKSAFAVEADRLSRELVEKALQAAERRAAAAGQKPGSAVTVFNTSSWPRTDLVLTTDIDTKRWIHPWWRHKVQVRSQIACFEPPAAVAAEPVVPPGDFVRRDALEGRGLALDALWKVYLPLGSGVDWEATRFLAGDISTSR